LRRLPNKFQGSKEETVTQTDVLISINSIEGGQTWVAPPFADRRSLALMLENLCIRQQTKE
jgi:hypothetical protein